MDLDEALEKVWTEPLDRVKDGEQGEQEKEKKERKLLFLEKKEVAPCGGDVVYRNEKFFVERSEGLIVIRPRYMKIYLKRIGTRRRNRYIRVVKGPNPIIIPLAATRENVERWLEEKFLRNVKKGQQGRFIEAVWEHRYQFLQEVTMG